MKKLFFLLALLCAFNAHSQNTLDKPVVCMPAKTLFSTLAQKYKEKLYWIGKTESEDSKFALLVNTETNSWTIVEFNKDLACILGNGVDYKNLFGLSI